MDTSPCSASHWLVIPVCVASVRDKRRGARRCALSRNELGTLPCAPTTQARLNRRALRGAQLEQLPHARATPPPLFPVAAEPTAAQPEQVSSGVTHLSLFSI